VLGGKVWSITGELEGSTMRVIRHFLHQQTGAVSIEYGLVGSLIFVTLWRRVTLVASQVAGLYAAVLALFP
jgi:Flp pilus assembly pilin Flp